MEAVQQKSKRAKLVIHEEYMHAVALKLLLQSSEYKTETQEWSKLPEDHKTWAAWTLTFREAYVAKQRAEAAREGEEKHFGGSALFEGAPEKPTNNYGGENIKRERGQPCSQIKLWNRWRDI